MDVKHPAAADLARIPLLAGLPAEVRQVLSERFEIEDFGAGQRLVAVSNFVAGMHRPFSVCVTMPGRRETR